MKDARIERDQDLADARQPTYAVAELDLHGVTRVRWG